MSRATWSEAVRTREKILLVDKLQHHDNRPLGHLVFESRKAKGPKRSRPIRLRNICPPDRRCLIATRLDALQKVQQIGLQVGRVVGRCHTVNAGGTILAGKPVGFLQPFQIDDVVQRGQSYPSFRSCQFSYPLPFRVQVCETQGSLPCFPSAVLSSWHPPFLGRVPVSPVPRRRRSY